MGPEPLSPVWSAVARVRRRLRLQAATRLAVRGLLAAAAAVLVALILLKLHLIGWRAVGSVGLGGGGLVVVLALYGALRRIDPLRVAAQIDRSHALHDRLASALQFAQVAAPARPTEPGSPVAAALRALAQQDAARAAQGVVPAIAAPWQRPAHLPLLGLLLLANLGVLVLRWPRARSGPPPATPVAASLAEAPRLVVEPELLAPEKEELEKLIAEAQQQGDPETAAILAEMQKLLQEVERGELTRQEAFARLSELEQRLMQGKDGTLEDLKQQLRKAGSELGEAKLGKELGQALVREDLERAQKELKKLAEQALARSESAQLGKDKQALAQAFEQAARSLSQKRDQSKDQSKDRNSDKNLKREDPSDPARQKDQWKDQNKSEELTRKLQELRDEERSLKKKLQENPRDQESERRLKKNQRELEQLEQEKRERDEARRELEQLEKDLERAAEQLQQQLAKMTPEQRQALEQLAKDMSRMADEIRKLQKQQKGRGQGMMALGSIKTVLRRIARSAPGGGQGQGQGDGQDKGPGQGRGQGQGQGQGQGKSGAMKDFQNRASGKGQGEEEVLVEGDGQKGDGNVMLLGEGEGTVLLPGLGGKQPGAEPGPGAPGQPGGDGIGKQHDPNLLGSPTQLDGKRRLTKVTGKEGAGPTRSETILGASERGFASAPYRKVYTDYTGVAEQVMSKERVPPGYRFYVKRYFQMIKPRE